ncbi:MAG: site-specific tyrosine recombinase/integron integrase [Methanoregulaceae archaeon]
MNSGFFSEWLITYREYLKMRNYSPRTMESYTQVIKHFAYYVWLHRQRGVTKLVVFPKDFDSARLEASVEVPPTMITDYLSFMSSTRTYKPKTTHRIISTLSSFYRFLTIHGGVKLNPMVGIERPRIKQQDIKYLKHSQVLQLIDSIEDPRDKLIVRTIYATGVRVSELCGINIGDIDFEEHTIKIRGKGDKTRMVFLDNDTAEAIRTFIGNQIEGPLFIGQQDKNISPRAIQHIFRHYAPTGITPHKIRHSYASELYRRSKNLRVVQENLGHTSIKTTEIYLHTDVDERRQVYQDYFPLSNTPKPT